MSQVCGEKRTPRAPAWGAEGKRDRDTEFTGSTVALRFRRLLEPLALPLVPAGQAPGRDSAPQRRGAFWGL